MPIQENHVASGSANPAGLAGQLGFALADAMLSWLIAATLVSACAAAQESTDPGPCPGRPAAADWRAAASEADRERLRDVRDAWDEALGQSRAAGHDAEIAGQGALFDPDAALRGPLPPPGDYLCRTVKLGSPAAGGGLPYVEYPRFRCRIRADGDTLSLVKLTGSQRPIGRIYADTERRGIFLGTLQLGDERRAYRYGEDSERDLVAAVERVGERRWRLVFPYPHFESLLDVIELTPAD